MRVQRVEAGSLTDFVERLTGARAGYTKTLYGFALQRADGARAAYCGLVNGAALRPERYLDGLCEPCHGGGPAANKELFDKAPGQLRRLWQVPRVDKNM